MQTTFILELPFAPADELQIVDYGFDGGSTGEVLRTYGDKYYKLRAFWMHDKVTAFKENKY